MRNTKRLLLNSLPYLAGFTWWLMSFPARLSADSLYILQNLKEGQWSELHSVIYHLFLYVTSLNGRAIWISSLIQVILMAFAVSFASNKALFYSSDNAKVITSTLIMISPFGGGYATTLWASVLSTVFTLLFLSLLMKVQDYKKRVSLVTAMCLGSLAVMLRQETFFVFVLSAIVLYSLFLLFKKRNFKVVVFVLTFSAVIGLSANLLLSKAMNAEPSPRYYRISAQMHDIAYLSLKNQNTILNENLPGIVEGKSLEGAKYCVNSVPFLFSEGFNYGKINVSDLYLNLIWIRSILADPLGALYLHICRASTFLPPPFSKGPPYLYYLHPGIDTNNLGFEFTPLISLNPSMKSFLTYSFDLLVSYVLWPGFLVGLNFLLFVLSKKRDDRDRIILSYSVANILILFLVVVAQDFRYAQSIFIFSFLMSISLILRRKSSLQMGRSN